MSYRILVTGSRHHTDQELIQHTLFRVVSEHFPDISLYEVGVRVTLIHGNALGADRLARDWAVKSGHLVETHDAKWTRYGRSAGSIRNQAMIDSGADLCVAFPMHGSKGTWDCVNRAKRAGIPVKVVKS